MPTVSELLDEIRRRSDAASGLVLLSTVPCAETMVALASQPTKSAPPQETVPQPRLVGVELNPGPSRTSRRIRSELGGLFGDMVADAGASLGSALATKVGKKKKKKKVKSGPSSSMPVSRQSVSSVSLPVQQGMKLENKFTKSTFRLAFDTTSLTIQTSATPGTVYFSDGVSTTAWVLELDPTVVLGTQPIFGGPVSKLADVFLRYRFLSLEAEYLPMVGSSAAGGVSFVVYSDPSVVNTSFPGWQPIVQADKSVTVPAWQGTKIDCSHITKDWLYVVDPVVHNTSTVQRQTSPGAIAVASPTGFNDPSAILGLLRLKGVLEFADPAAIAAPPTLAAASSSSSSLPQADEAKNFVVI